MQPRLQGGGILAESLDNKCLFLRDNPNAPEDRDGHQNQNET